MIKMLNRLKELNPAVKFYSVSDAEFAQFGRIININTDQIVAAGKSIANPASGSSYVPSEPSFEALPIAKEISDQCYGELPVQVGYCWGESHKLNALEWHTSSEVNIAVTDLVLLLAPLQKVKNGQIPSTEASAFFVPQGTCIEVYATSMHFCPIQVHDSGFGCVVALPQGTNVPLDGEHDDRLLFRKNKWLICCEDNQALIDKGVAAGISGENFEIKY